MCCALDGASSSGAAIVGADGIQWDDHVDQKDVIDGSAPTSQVECRISHIQQHHASYC
jgi:hypothetical protein